MKKEEEGKSERASEFPMIQCSCGFGLIPAVEISQVHVYKYCVCESFYLFPQSNTTSN